MILGRFYRDRLWVVWDVSQQPHFEMLDLFFREFKQCRFAQGVVMALTSVRPLSSAASCKIW
jgi:hypothetical protein